MSAELLPCPFCGDEPKLREPNELEVWRVACECCGARHEATTRQRVIVAWNNRRTNGLVNWLEAEMKKFADKPIYANAKYQELKRCRRMVKRLLGQ